MEEFSTTPKQVFNITPEQVGFATFQQAVFVTCCTQKAELQSPCSYAHYDVIILHSVLLYLMYTEALM